MVFLNFSFTVQFSFGVFIFILMLLTLLTTKNCDIFNAFKFTLVRLHIKLKNLSGVITDGGGGLPWTVGKNEGLVTPIKKEMSSCDGL